MTVPEYLAAVQRMHAVGLADMARALRVSASVVRRWARGTHVPPWGRLRSMVALWGGNAELLALGAALQRWARTTGVPVEDGIRVLSTGRRSAGPAPRRGAGPRRDRRQLSLPIAR